MASWRLRLLVPHGALARAFLGVGLAFSSRLVAFTSAVLSSRNMRAAAQRLWIQVQAFSFIPLINPLVAAGWQFFLHPKHALRTKNYGELLAMGARFPVFCWLAYNRGVGAALFYYLAYNGIAANYIFINFAVSHTHLPVVPKEDTTVDWVRYAAIHTMNVTPGYFNFVDWWMSYLNYQIEHHLYPSMPQFRHPIVSQRIRTLFAKHNILYDERDYITSMAVTFKNLHNVGMDVFYG